MPRSFRPDVFLTVRLDWITYAALVDLVRHLNPAADLAGYITGGEVRDPDRAVGALRELAARAAAGWLVPGSQAAWWLECVLPGRDDGRRDPTDRSRRSVPLGIDPPDDPEDL